MTTLLQNYKWTVSIGASVAILAAGLAWFFWPHGDAAQIAKVKELGQKLMESRGQNANSEERRELFGQMRQAMQELTPAQREELMKERQQAMQQEMDKYFTLNKEEQTAYLDSRIDQMEQMRQRFENMRNQNLNKAQENRGPRPPRQPLTKAQREERMIRRLDSTTPEQRAKMGEFMKSMQKRREERGLPDLPFPRR